MLPNDVCRCEGISYVEPRFPWICGRRNECARYLERHTGGEQTPHHQYLCDDGDFYIPADTLK